MMQHDCTLSQVLEKIGGPTRQPNTGGLETQVSGPFFLATNLFINPTNSKAND